jgi:hypothetical protein
MATRRRPGISAFLPLWFLFALRFLLARHRPEGLVVPIERTALQKHLLDLLVLRAGTPQPESWLEGVIHQKMTAYLDREIHAVEVTLIVDVSSVGELPGGGFDPSMEYTAPGRDVESASGPNLHEGALPGREPGDHG